MSADLALMLLDAVDRLEASEQFFVHFLEWQELKGVIEGRPYPVVWLDTLDDRIDLERQAESLRGIIHVNDHMKLKKFLRDFIDGEQKLLRPFIHSDSDPKYRDIPNDLKELYESMKAEESSRGYEDRSADVSSPSDTQTSIPDPMHPLVTD